MKKRILAILLASLMTASLASCASSDSSSSETDSSKAEDSSVADSSKEESSSKEDVGEVVTLKMLSMPSNTSGLVEGWSADIVKEKVGVEIELLPSGDQGEQKLQALMASGELPDLVVFKDTKQVANAVAGDMLLAYDDYKDIVPNIYKNGEQSLQYYSDNVSEGKNKAYSVGNSIQTQLETKGELNWGPYLRYDLYKEVGSPEIKTIEDYLPVLKQMQDKYPKNADGQKVYAFSLWKDWDNAVAMQAQNIGCVNGISTDILGQFGELDVTANTIKSCMDEDSSYLRGLKFYYEANQMGLMDPDSLTQRFEDALEKATNGRTLFSWWGWATGTFDSPENQNKGIGFMPVEAQDAKILHQGLSPIGKLWSASVSKATKYPEKAMKFIDWTFFSDEGTMTMYNGPQGVTWDLDANGKPVVLEEGYPYLRDATKELPGGGTMGKSINGINIYGLKDTEINATYGVPFGNRFWDKPDYAPADTALKQTWCKDFGATDQIDYLTQKDKIAVAPFAPIPPVPNDIEQMTARIGDVVKTNSWKMMFAKDEAEYNKLKAEMQEKAKGMGIDKVMDWYKTEYEKAFDLGAKYSK